ncbi:hypothetical protein DCS_03469 [Drechmeria coniospora]|uniref:Lipase 1 n=1 Tax=Drechmeria coniospora TaxID=98403 RepID=A0A151GHC4_DRECN|nr:hypothetical protein DCS_03469 [Drechmeria coniospora]KYK56469.1 hypothetical protein DCS_03469 [Drechmeria coniospora]
MLRLWKALVVAALFAGSSLSERSTVSADASPLRIRAAAEQGPVPPKEDPWYTAPARWEVAEPGQILRLRSAPGNLTTVVGNCSAAYNILYRTTDSRYNPTWAVTTLFVPEDGESSAFGKALLSFQLPYDSADLNASPSYAVYETQPIDIALALGRGWFVSVPDYEGPLASFTAGVMSGHATIDSVRAVRAASFGLLPDARYAMWGYSGGALASEWAAELATQYAPELAFAGTAIGGLTPNITTVLLTVEGSPAVGLVPAGIVGLASQWPALRRYVDDNLKTEGRYNKTGFLATENYTVIENAAEFAGQNMADYFVNGLDIIRAPVAQRALRSDGQMGYHGVPQMPLYVYKAVEDEVSPINETDALVARYCGIGVDVTYLRNTAGGHTAEYYNGRPGALEFLTAVLMGRFNGTGCAVKDVKVSRAPSGLLRRDLSRIW